MIIKTYDIKITCLLWDDLNFRFFCQLSELYRKGDNRKLWLNLTVCWSNPDCFFTPLRNQVFIFPPDDYIRYAYGMVCDYIPSDVASQLREHMK